MGCRTVSADAKELLDSLTSWDANWKGLRVVVAGMGLSGFSAADTLIELGAIVTVIDGKDDKKNQQRGETLKIVGAHEVLLGAEHVTSLPLVAGEQAQLVMVSPGWNPRNPVIAQAADLGIAIWKSKYLNASQALEEIHIPRLATSENVAIARALDLNPIPRLR